MSLWTQRSKSGWSGSEFGESPIDTLIGALSLLSGVKDLRMTPWILGAGVWAGLAVGLSPTPALAHERREVGKYQLVVGFNVEPALQAEPNGAQITVTVPSENGRAVEGLADTLRVAVAHGGGPARDFRLRSVFGTPGRYVADLIPTRPGTYVFTFTGTIEGMSLDERFESGPGRFNDVEAVETLQFPEAIPPANDAARLARTASEDASDAAASVAQARALAIGGLLVGIAGRAAGRDRGAGRRRGSINARCTAAMTLSQHYR